MKTKIENKNWKQKIENKTKKEIIKKIEKDNGKWGKMTSDKISRKKVEKPDNPDSIFKPWKVKTDLYLVFLHHLKVFLRLLNVDLMGLDALAQMPNLNSVVLTKKSDFEKVS